MLRTAWGLALAALTVAACAGSTQDATNPDPQPSETAVETAEPVRTAAPKASADPYTGGDDAREISATDCHQLALKYGDVLRADEVAKLPPNQSATDRARTLRSLDEASAKLEARWEAGCVADLVGKFTSESGLRCAMSSKTVAGFEACINGPPAPPAGASGPSKDAGKK